VAMRIELVGALLLTAFTLSAQDTRTSAIVPVPDAGAALSIAEPALIKVYGKRQIDYEKPLTASLDNGIWNVHGTLCCPDPKGKRTCEIGKCLGGVAAVKIRQSDGKILSISHTK
jgi:NTF2 fold immunity protein